ncbi:MAG: aminotransferase class I/II-fold pyridoxal phosphate-dependent enzyme [Chloroflexia bacterium]|nr:aminotransferase class I/II-fold pyridoxal phosphate-dependent enzyme [Chloroflexia bacterium]
MSEHFSTQSVHAGEQRPKPYGAITTPIVQTSTYTFTDTASIVEFMQQKAAGQQHRDEYGRYSNPTQRTVEAKIAALEGGETALLFASGMAAITTTMLTLLSSGDHLVFIQDCYRRTREFVGSYLSRWGIESTGIPADQAPNLEQALRPHTRLIFCEMPTNPYLRLIDLEQVAALAHQHGLLCAIDSTFATPINLQPLAHGIDLVLHSATKYLGGHNDLLAGAVVGRRQLLSAIEKGRGVLGGVAGPQEAYLLLRGLKTLDLRVRRQNENAQRVAEFLQEQAGVERVYYPGLPSHPDHELARRLLRGCGGVVSFELRGGHEATSRFVDRLRLPYLGPTLGGVESIAQQQALFISLDPAERRAAGLSDSLVRYAVGIEDAADIIADLEQALEGGKL